MKKVLKALFVIAAVLALLFVGVGFLWSPTYDDRTAVVIEGRPLAVFAIVSNPKKVPEWLPKQAADIKEVKYHASGVVSAIAQGVFNPTGAKGDEPTHTYVMTDGTTLEMQVTAYELGERYVERVVGGTNSLLDLFKEVTWGFEVAPVEGDPKKTSLTVINTGRAVKPVGNFLNALMHVTGLSSKNAEEIAHNVEKVARGDAKPKESGEEPAQGEERDGA